MHFVSLIRKNPEVNQKKNATYDTKNPETCKVLGSEVENLLTPETLSINFTYTFKLQHIKNDTFLLYIFCVK